jgi:hypothetical protein
MRALVEEVDVDVAYRREEAVGILALPRGAVLEVEAHLVGQGERSARQDRREEPAIALALHLERITLDDQVAARRRGMERPHHDAAGHRMRAQDAMRLVMPSILQRETLGHRHGRRSQAHAVRAVYSRRMPSSPILVA